MNAAAFATAVLVLLAPAVQAASPCEAPERFVRAGKLDVAPVSQPTPLLRPYVVGGIPAVAVREEGGRRWLELAVHSAGEARRQLAGRVDAPDVDVWSDRVWLRCPTPART
jgi:hypothetical protein